MNTARLLLVALAGLLGASSLIAQPVSQEAYLKASNTDVNDNFGSSVAIDGKTLVVGARHEDSASPGIDGAQDNSLVPGDAGAPVGVALSNAIKGVTP